MSLKRSIQVAILSPALPMPNCTLGLAEKCFVEDALADVAPDWTVELDGICEDEASLILLPEGGDDMRGPSFIISREGFAFRLDQLHWDEVDEVGIFADLVDVLYAVEATLTADSCRPGMPSPTRH